MQDLYSSATAPRQRDGTRDLQAKLYRDIGISAVAAALYSIAKPEPQVPSTPSQTAGHRLPRVA